MLTFLYLAANAGFRIDSYSDNPVGEMATNADGRQFIAKITLDPQIEWAGELIPTRDDIEKLHREAHKACYIANTILSEITIKGF